MKRQIDRPYNNGEWTTARMRGFIMSALRRAQWPVKYKSISKAFVSHGINPTTGRKCKLHKCEECGEQFPAGQMQADHIQPVVPLDGVWGDTTSYLGYNWNEVVQRLYAPLENFQALDRECHKKKSAEEKAIRAQFKREQKK